MGGRRGGEPQKPRQICDFLANIYFNIKDQTTTFNYYCKSLDIIESTLLLDQQTLARVTKLFYRIDEVEF